VENYLVGIVARFIPVNHVSLHTSTSCKHANAGPLQMMAKIVGFAGGKFRWIKKIIILNTFNLKPR